MNGSERPASVRKTTRRVVAVARETDIGVNAAALAYYALAAFVPAVLLLATLITTVWGDRAAEVVVVAAGEALSPSGRRLLRDALTGSAGRVQASAGSLLVFLWAVLRLFRALNGAVGRVYGTESSVQARFADAFLAIACVAGAVAAVVSARLVAAVTGTPFTGLSVVVGRLAVATVLLAPLYYTLPDVDHAVTDVLPGTVLVAGGWELLRIAFDLYLAVGGGNVAGLLGAVVLFVTWLFLGSALVLVRVVTNALVAGYR